MIESEPLERLMRRYQDGDITAFDALYAAVAPSLLQYLAALARDRERGRDLVQETFLQVHRARHTYRPPLPIRPWLFAIARHVWLMDQRTRSRRPLATGELPDLPVRGAVERLADRATIRRALARVAPDRREALLLHHLWGFSFAEIGQMLGISTDAAKLRSSRGIRDLELLVGSSGSRGSAGS
jgi:RNA polymerase sigma-70 factor, ECF subfamily